MSYFYSPLDHFDPSPYLTREDTNKPSERCPFAVPVRLANEYAPLNSDVVGEVPAALDAFISHQLSNGH